MSIQEYGTSFKDRVSSWHLMRKAAWILAIALVCYGAYWAFFINYSYSDGTRTGFLRKLSHKGMVFKTWEGELQMSGIPAPVEQGQLATGGNVWLFSVKSGDEQVIKDLQDAEARNVRVTLNYTQYLKKFVWRGETEYFVTKVTPQQ